MRSPWLRAMRRPNCGRSLPDTVHGPLRELVQGIVKLDGSLLLVLDPELLSKPDVCLFRETDNVRGETAIGQVRSTASQLTTK